MIQFIQEKNMLRLRVVLLFMATVILPFLLMCDKEVIEV